MKSVERILIAIWCGVMSCSSLVLSQDHGGAMGRLSVTSNVARAKVFVDSMYVGVAPLTDYHLNSGKHLVCVVPSNIQNWLLTSVCDEVEVDSGGQARLTLNLPRQIRIASEPYAARISYRDSIIGKTPFILSTFAENGMITLSKDGYENLTLTFDVSTPFLYGLLVSQGGASNNLSSLYLEKEELRNTVPIIVTASSAVVTGIAAAYLKIRADNLYSEYRTTGNTEQLRQIRQLDVASGVAFGISQLSLALLTYFLLSR